MQTLAEPARRVMRILVVDDLEINRDLLVLEAMGGGFTWGAAAVRY